MYIVVFYRYTSECKYTFQVIASVVLVLLLVTVHVALGKLSGTDQSTDRVSSIIGFIGIGVSIILCITTRDDQAYRLPQVGIEYSNPLCVVVHDQQRSLDGRRHDHRRLFVTIPNAVCLGACVDPMFCTVFYNCNRQASGQGDLNKDQMDAITGHFSSTTSNTSAGDFEENEQRTVTQWFPSF
ncbi:hypothetical protein FI667_g7187, partial [Globisporangium splendens]